jgi:hypothetical protein
MALETKPIACMYLVPVQACIVEVWRRLQQQQHYRDWPVCRSTKIERKDEISLKGEIDSDAVRDDVGHLQVRTGHYGEVMVATEPAARRP